MSDNCDKMLITKKIMSWKTKILSAVNAFFMARGTSAGVYLFSTRRRIAGADELFKREEKY